MEDSLPLRDIHLPDPSSWFPPAIGWWLLLVLCLAAVLILRWMLKRLKQPRLKKYASREIESLIEDYLAQGDEQYFIQQLSIAMKRIGMSYFDRDQVAGSSGLRWLYQLNELAPGQWLSDAQLQLLATAPYQRSPGLDDAEIRELIDAVRRWLGGLPGSAGRASV